MWADLFANVVGGFVAAGLIALCAYLWNRHKHKILKELTIIMGQAIEHRNIGQLQTYADKNLWIQKAKEIESAAVAKAKELSPTAGSLVEWLDKVTPWNVNSDVE